MKRLATALSLLLLTGAALAQKPAELRVYFIDVEGGQSTLFAAPGGETLLTGRVDGSFTVFNSRSGETVPYPATEK